MDRREIELAMNLFDLCQAAVYNRLARARATGQPETLAGVAHGICPAAELGVKLVTGEIEVSDVGALQLAEALEQYNIRLEGE